MNKLFCPRCGAENSAEMTFCTNCGRSFAVPTTDPSSVRPAFSSAAPGIHSQMPTAVLPAATAAATPTGISRGWLFGLLGCGGLAVAGLIALIVGGALIGMRGSDPLTTGGNNSNVNVAVVNSVADPTGAEPSAPLNSGALDELRSLKQVGAFRQSEMADIPAGEVYPAASEAVQVTYRHGRQSVTAVVARFPSSEAALADYDARMTAVREARGKVYTTMNKSGTRGAAYQYKGYYYIEACGEAVCWRNYSSELNAVRNFAVKFPGGSSATTTEKE